MTDPRLLKIEAARNEIKTLAADLHELTYAEMRARLDSLVPLTLSIFTINQDIEFYPYVEGTFTEIETFSLETEPKVLFLNLDGKTFRMSQEGEFIEHVLSEEELENKISVRHVDCFIPRDFREENNGKDMVIGYSEEKYDGWGFSHNGHDYMFYKGSAIRRTTDN